VISIDWSEMLDLLLRRIERACCSQAKQVLEIKLEMFKFTAPRLLDSRESVLQAWELCRSTGQDALVTREHGHLEGVVTRDTLEEIASLLGCYAGLMPVRTTLNRRYRVVPSSCTLHDALKLLRGDQSDFILVYGQDKKCIAVISAATLVVFLSEHLPKAYFEQKDSALPSASLNRVADSGEQRLS